MLMSKSRLEKFLYALYSLDSSDLPAPLSRIEELYKCLVTGEEAPTFKPLSRVEKYLMAILGGYDVELLPNPLSRVEALLYKLATGDDNLDDVKSFLSEHEELLAEIIRNWGVGGNIEYVLYTLSTNFNTLYNTTEEPVKSAILTGQTLVNVHPTDYIVAGSNSTFFLSKIIPKTMIKPNTRYFLRLYNTHQSIVRAYFKPCVNNIVNLISSDNKCAIVTTKSEFTENDFNNNKIHFYSSSGLALEDVKDTKVILCEYVDGMENWDIPYFEGMKSVQMPVLTTTGKNLFNPTNLIDGNYVDGSGNIIGGSSTRSMIELDCNGIESLIISANENVGSGIAFYDNNNFIKFNNAPLGVVISVPTNASRCIYKFDKQSSELNDLNVQIEQGSTATTYEPHKSNILTVNEPVELRGIGNVKDELDLVTGEVTQRIGEVVFDGSEYWVRSADENSTMFYTSFNNLVRKEYYLNSISCDKFVVYANEWYLFNSTSPNGISAYADWAGTYPNENWIYIKYADSEGYVEKLKQWLSQNPITVQYELATESVKTIDISTVNQDGNSTKLKTFDDITYVALSSEGLIPEAELEVATKNEEVLSTLSLEMDDISTAQTTLEETSNAQSENVDATMIATTEIYEGLL